MSTTRLRLGFRAEGLERRSLNAFCLDCKGGAVGGSMAILGIQVFRHGASGLGFFYWALEYHTLILFS